MDSTLERKLPPPLQTGTVSLEEVFSKRRTVRKIERIPLKDSVVFQLIWSLQGFARDAYDENRQAQHRTTPSAGGTYPLLEYVLTQEGFFIYKPKEHSLKTINSEDLRVDLSIAASTEINQQSIADAPLTIILAVNNKLASNLSPILEDVLRYVYLETGHATQNLILQAHALDLGVCTITSFKIGKVYEVLKIPLDQRPIYILPVGHPHD